MTEIIARKLVAVLNRLGSNHDGERAAAGLIAHRMAEGCGGWDHLLTPRATVVERPAIQPMSPSADHQRRARMMLIRIDLLTAWEQQFVRAMAEQRRLSSAQRDKLNAIYRAMCTKDGAHA